MERKALKWLNSCKVNENIVTTKVHNIKAPQKLITTIHFNPPENHEPINKRN